MPNSFIIIKNNKFIFMKKIFSLFIIISFISLSVFAQEERKVLTHHMTPDEKANRHLIGKDFVETDPPVGEVRNIAEWEQMEGVLIAYNYGFGIPYTLIAEMSQDCIVTTIVYSASEESTVRGYYTSNGVNLENCNFIHAPIETYWVRDYSPWYVAVDNSEVSVINFPYNRPQYPNVNDIPIRMSEFLEVPLYGMNVIHTGGNYMCDGYGQAASTTLTIEENQDDLTQAEIEQKMLEYLGIETYHLLEDPMGAYIEHIDCWGKFIDVDKVLITEVPDYHVNYENYEAIAAYFSETDCSYGYPYQVYRVFSLGNDQYTGDQNPYTNSLILNNKVFVPQTNSQWDDEALNVYQQAMPGYEIIGIEAGYNSWINTDALHCRTHGIADREMLYINHIPISGTIDSEPGYTVEANIYSYAGNSLEEGSPVLNYSIDGLFYEEIEMALSSKSNTYTVTIPEQAEDTEILYYINAEDTEGKIAYHPYIGESDPHIFTAGATIPVNIFQEKEKAENFNIYPNPSTGNFFVWVNLNDAETVNIKISTITGKIIFNEQYEMNSGGDLQNINIIGVAAGIYNLEMKTNKTIQTKKLIIK